MLGAHILWATVSSHTVTAHPILSGIEQKAVRLQVFKKSYSPPLLGITVNSLTDQLADANLPTYKIE